MYYKKIRQKRPPPIAVVEHVTCFTTSKTKLASLKLKVVKATHSHVTQSGMP